MIFCFLTGGETWNLSEMRLSVSKPSQFIGLELPLAIWDALG